MAEPFPKSKQTGRAARVKRTAPGSTMPAATKPIPSQSAKRADVYATRYLPARKRYLKAHPRCEMKITTPAICTGKSTTIQHTIQRSLDPSEENLLDESRWLAACLPCNTWAGAHPAEAIALGVETDPKVRT